MRTLIPMLMLIANTASAQEAPLRVEVVAHIGCVDCTGAELFYSIQSVTVANGRVIVLDGTAPFVRVFDASGRLIRAFAGKGNGPGELQLPIHAGARANGEVEIYDMRQLRFTRFDSAGVQRRTRPMSGFIAWAVSVPGAGESYLLRSDFVSTDQPLLRFPDNAAEPGAIATLTADFPKLAPGEHARIPALAARPGGGIAVGDGIAEYRIRRFDANGRNLGDIVRDIPKQRKSAAELEQERERMQRRAARMQAMVRAEGGGAPTRFEPREERNHFGMNAMAYDDTGRLWVRTERGGLTATVFDIFDATGRYLGQLRVNEKLGAFAVDRGVLAARVVDADEVEYVGIWRVR